MGAKRASFPRFRREGPAPRLELTADDEEILRRVFRYRFVRADNLYRLFPDRSQDRLSRRLTQLFRARFLDRPLAQIDYFRGEGSQSLAYGLDNEGARFLIERCGVSVGSGDWKSRNRSYTRENLDHTLSVSRFLIDLELSCRARPGASLISFDEILQNAPEPTRRAARPDRWPVALRSATATADVYVVPDAIVGIRLLAPGGKGQKAFFFVEVDRGTMTIVPAPSVRDSEAFLFRSTMLRKFTTYAESYRQALHQRYLGLNAPRVLFLTTSETRARAMREASYRLVIGPMGLPVGLFLFGVSDAANCPLRDRWTDAAGNPVQLDADEVRSMSRSDHEPAVRGARRE